MWESSTSERDKTKVKSRSWQTSLQCQPFAGSGRLTHRLIDRSSVTIASIACELTESSLSATLMRQAPLVWESKCGHNLLVSRISHLDLHLKHLSTKVVQLSRSAAILIARSAAYETVNIRSQCGFSSKKPYKIQNLVRRQHLVPQERSSLQHRFRR